MTRSIPDNNIILIKFKPGEMIIQLKAPSSEGKRNGCPASPAPIFGAYTAKSATKPEMI
jgi:hypothetical protein